MLDVRVTPDGVISLSGRLDAARVEEARPVFEAIESPCTLDFEGLDYISSAGLGLLLETQYRLGDAVGPIRIINMSPLVRNVFLYAGFDLIFDIE